MRQARAGKRSVRAPPGSERVKQVEHVQAGYNIQVLAVQVEEHVSSFHRRSGVAAFKEAPGGKYEEYSVDLGRRSLMSIVVYRMQQCMVVRSTSGNQGLVIN